MAAAAVSLALSYTDDNSQCKDISSSWTTGTLKEDSRMTADVLVGVRRVLLGATIAPPPPAAGIGQLDGADVIVVVNRGANDVIIDVKNAVGADVSYFRLTTGQFMVFNNQEFEADGAGAAFAALVKIGEIGGESLVGTGTVEVALYSTT